MPNDCVELLSSTANALDGLVCHVGRVNADMPSVAWLLATCKHLPDEEQYFPHGKWATIQHIEQQLDNIASATAAAIERDRHAE